MSSMEEHILRTAKEIIVKFIETGRISPTSFHENFRSIYRTVQEAVQGSEKPPDADSDEEAET